MTLPFDATAARSLETLVAVDRQLQGAAERLADAATRAVGLSAQTDWRTDAATRFHTLADAWQHDVATLEGEVSLAREEVGRIRRRIEALVWGPAV